MVKRRTNGNGAATAESEHQDQTTASGSETRKTRRTTRKSAAARIPEEVTVDFQAVKEKLQEATTWVKEAASQAEEIRTEASQVQTQMQEQAKETKAEASEALRAIRKARREVEADLQLHRATRAEAEQEIQRARQQLDEARRRFDQACIQTAESRRNVEEQTPPPPEPAPAPPQVDRPVVTLQDVAGEGEKIIQATIRAEPAQTRLTRHLNQAYSAESAMLDAMQELSEEIIDPTLQSILGEHRGLTHRHQMALESRLQALGAEPSTNGKGVLERTLGWIWESRQREPDDYDRIVQGWVKATTAEHFEVAMYRALASLANAIGDDQTEQLALTHQQQKQEAVDALEAYAPSLASLAVQMVGVAHAADPQRVVIEAEVKEPDQPETERS